MDEKLDLVSPYLKDGEILDIKDSDLQPQEETQPTWEPSKTILQ